MFQDLETCDQCCKGMPHRIKENEDAGIAAKVMRAILYENRDSAALWQ